MGDVRKEKFEALFDGDEVEGKFYAIGDVITGLDAATSTYLLSIGRIARCSPQRAKELKEAKAERAKEAAKAEKEADAAAQAAAEEAEKQREADQALAEEVETDFKAGTIPSDLLNPEAAENAKDKLVSRDKLVDLAKGAGIENIPDGKTKPEIAMGIMFSRAKAAANAA